MDDLIPFEPILLAATVPAPGPWFASLIPALPLLGCVLCGLCAAFRIKSRLPAFLSVVLLGLAFVVTVQTYRVVSVANQGGPLVTTAFEWINFTWGTRPGEHLVANAAWYLDSLTMLWMLFVTGLGALIALYASEYMAHDVGAGYCRFFAAFNLFVFSMSCLVMGDNLLLLYLGWEGVGLCSYLLIGYFYKRPSAVAAAKKAFIVNRIGDLGLALGVMLAFVTFGTVEYHTLFADATFQRYLAAARAGDFAAIPFRVQLIPILLMVGAFGKSAQGPLYVWLPDAMEGPTPVSALIHAATMVTAGVYLIARTYPAFQVSEHALTIVAWTGAVTALWSATIGMAQFDIKRIMAYSTVSQLGYMFAGLGVLTSTGAAFHVFTHAFFKAALFLCCGAVMHGFAGQLDLRKLSGVAFMKGWGIVAVCMLVGCLNLAGFPFTAGFFSKDMILAQAFTTPGFAPIGWILLVTAGLTAYYTFRVFFRVFLGPKEFEPGDEVHGHEEHGDEHRGEDAGHKAQSSRHNAHSEERVTQGATSDGGAHGPGEFHPHPPGWAINTVLAVLAIGSILAAGTYFIDREHHGWVGSMIAHSTAALPAPGEHEGAAAGAEAHAVLGTFMGRNPHEVMYYVSGAVGAIGIVIAFFLHLLGRTTAATSRADDLVPLLGPVAGWARRKWYVDEFYDFLLRTPLWVVANLFHWIDQLLVDGLVNLFGFLPRAIGWALRPSQSGVLHGYAVGMAGGIAVLLLIILVVAS